MESVEIINDGEVPLAYIVRAGWAPEKTQFLTPEHFNQQMGMIVYRKGQTIQPHLHIPVRREINGTTECILVRKGSCSIDIFDNNKQLMCTKILREGDIVLLISGGHGFYMDEDTVLFEVKQGPYVGMLDKERF